MSEIENTLNDFGRQLVNSLKSSLQNAKPGASLDNDIDFTLQTNGDAYNLQLSLPSYYKWIDGGRKPGRFPSPQVLTNWINNKGLKLSSKKIRASSSKTLSPQNENKSLAFLIGRKIATKGISATNFYSNVVNNNAFTQLNTALSIALKQTCLNQLSI